MTNRVTFRCLNCGHTADDTHAPCPSCDSEAWLMQSDYPVTKEVPTEE